MNTNINLLDENEFQRYLRFENENSEQSLITHLTSMKTFIKFKFKNKENFISENMFDEIAIKDFVKYKEYLIRRGLLGNTITTKINGLIAFCRFMEEEYNKDVDILILNLCKLKKKTKIITKEKYTLTQEETTELLEYIKNDYSKPFRLRNYLFFSLILGLGLRLTETTKLKEEDIVLNEKILKLNPTNTKGNKRAVLPLKDSLIEVYKEYIDWKRQNKKFSSNPYVFISRESNNDHWNKSTVQQTLRKYLVESNIANNKVISPHRLRATIATLLNEWGASDSDVQAQLRHSDIKTTTRYINKDIVSLNRIKNINKLEF